MLCAKRKCATEGKVSSHCNGTPLGIKRFVKSMEIKANAEGLLNWLQFFLTTAQNYENVKGLNLEKAG